MTGLGSPNTGATYTCAFLIWPTGRDDGAAAGSDSCIHACKVFKQCQLTGQELRKYQPSIG